MSKKQIKIIKSKKKKLQEQEFKDKSREELIQLSKNILLDLEENPSKENMNKYLDDLEELIDQK